MKVCLILSETGLIFTQLKEEKKFVAKQVPRLRVRTTRLFCKPHVVIQFQLRPFPRSQIYLQSFVFSILRIESTLTANVNSRMESPPLCTFGKCCTSVGVVLALERSSLHPHSPPDKDCLFWLSVYFAECMKLCTFDVLHIFVVFGIWFELKCQWCGYVSGVNSYLSPPVRWLENPGTLQCSFLADRRRSAKLRRNIALAQHCWPRCVSSTELTYQQTYFCFRLPMPSFSMEMGVQGAPSWVSRTQTRWWVQNFVWSDWVEVAPRRTSRILLEFDRSPTHTSLSTNVRRKHHNGRKRPLYGFVVVV